MSRHRNWCVTINNYSQNDLDAWSCNDFMEGSLGISYYVFATEVGKSGTKHIQAYVEFKTPVTLKGIIKKLGKHGHYEPRRGTAEEASNYCKKDGDYFEWGQMKQSNGKRKDWAIINDNIINGFNVKKQIEAGFCSLQHIQHIEKISKYLEPYRNWEPTVYWFWGPSGSGKSKTAAEMFPDAFWVPSFQWWDGYDAHETIIIDDYRADFCKFHDLLKLLDRYPYKVPIKGGYRNLLAKNIVITTPWDHRTTWANKNAEAIYQLTRRIHKEVFFAQASLGNTT